VTAYRWLVTRGLEPIVPTAELSFVAFEGLGAMLVAGPSNMERLAMRELARELFDRVVGLYTALIGRGGPQYTSAALASLVPFLIARRASHRAFCFLYIGRTPFPDEVALDLLSPRVTGDLAGTACVFAMYAHSHKHPAQRQAFAEILDAVGRSISEQSKSGIQMGSSSHLDTLLDTLLLMIAVSAAQGD
jgi:hypothetical protein